MVDIEDYSILLLPKGKASEIKDDDDDENKSSQNDKITFD